MKRHEILAFAKRHKLLVSQMPDDELLIKHPKDGYGGLLVRFGGGQAAVAFSGSDLLYAIEEVEDDQIRLLFRSYVNDF